MPSFESLYEAYFEEVYRYAFALCGHKETAEDVTAETFLKAMQHLGTFRGDCDFAATPILMYHAIFELYCKFEISKIYYLYFNYFCCNFQI